MEMKDDWFVPPILRGCSFDGEKGKIIITDRTGTEAAGTTAGGMPADEGGAEADADALFLEPDVSEDGIIDGWGEYKDTHGAEPRVVVRKGAAAYALGGTYGEAREVLKNYRTGKPQGGKAASRKTAGYDRNAVVQGKIAVVTGGAQGFGEGLVRELVRSGALVFIVDLNLEGAAKLAEELNQNYGEPVAVPAEVNVADEESVARMVRTVVDRAGGVDIFISNAGVLKAGSVKEMDLRDFRLVTEVNYIGYFLCAKYASPVMALQNKPSGAYYSDIIQINSKSGLEGSNKNGAYAGGKFGGIGLTQSFAKELVTDNIKVNSICPGNFFDGPLWSDPEKGLFVQYLEAGKVPGAQTVEEVRRFYEKKVPMDRGCGVEDVVKAVYYVIEQRYETGQAVPVTGGQNMLK